MADGGPVPVAEQGRRVVWSPLPGSQAAALACPCNHILYEGTRGPGKTDAQLMKFRRYVGMGYGRFWRGIIFDHEYKHLDDLIAKAQRWFPAFNDGAKFLSGTGQLKWVWPTGEELLFRVVKKVKDYWQYHGHEYPYIGWNELTKYPTRELYDLMMSLNRTSFVPEENRVTIDGDHYRETGEVILLPPETAGAELYQLPDIPLIVFSTSNPFGPGHNWVKRSFITIAKPGQVVRTTTTVHDPRTQKKVDVTKTQVRLFGSYKENKYLAPEYIAELEGIKEENRRKAWLYGDWDVVAGGMFDDLWNSDVHVVPRFPIPKGWTLDRSMDWGSTHPFWIGWWAEADGEEVEMPDGRVWAPARGSLILFHEWYGTKEIGSNKGIRVSAPDIAVGVLEREYALKKGNWIRAKVQAGPADNQIRDVRESDVDTIEKKMSDKGVHWTESDKSQGSRLIGAQLFRDRLEAALTGEGAAIYFMQHCRGAVETIPVLPRDEKKLDDVDTDAEDHPYDGTRYRVLKGANRTAKSVRLVRSR